MDYNAPHWGLKSPPSVPIGHWPLITISHIRSIDYQLNAAAQYKEYLERRQTVLSARKKEEIRRESRNGQIASYADHDRGSGGEPRQDPGRDDANEPDGEADPADGSHKRYA